MPDQKPMWTRCLGGFSVMWVTKLLISPVKKGFFAKKTTKFGPKLAFLVNLGHAMQAYSVPCWWVSWLLWRAGCILQDTYLLYKYQSIYLRQCFRPWDAHVQLAIDVREKTFKANNSTRREVQKLLKHHTGSSKPCWQDWPKKEAETNLLKLILVHILNKHINAARNR